MEKVMPVVKIDEKITIEQYKEIQKFYFYIKKRRLFWILIVAVFGIGIAAANVINTGKIYPGTVFFLVLPVLCIILTNMRINSVVKQLYERDITEWIIEIEPTLMRMRPKKITHFITIPSKNWYRAYELNSVIVLYFTPNQFVSISKMVLNDEELMTVKGIIYDALGRKFKLKNKKKK